LLNSDVESVLISRLDLWPSPRPVVAAKTACPGRCVIGNVPATVHLLRSNSSQTKYARQAIETQHAGCTAFSEVCDWRWPLFRREMSGVSWTGNGLRLTIPSSWSRADFALQSVLFQKDFVTDDRRTFLMLATLFQGAICLLALGVGWLLGTSPFEHWQMNLHSLGYGVAGAIPMLLMFAVTYLYPVGPLKAIKEFLIEALGPSLSECAWYDLIWVAFLAGFSEELMFRGVIQKSLGYFGWWVALLVSNVLFGMAHAITLTYVLLAALLGIYLGLLFEVAGQQNLLVPIVTHTIYDLIAFFVVRQSFRNRPNLPKLAEPTDSGISSAPQ